MSGTPDRGFSKFYLNFSRETRAIPQRRVQPPYIDRGCLWQKPFEGSFHSRFRKGCLNREVFLDLLYAKVAIAGWPDRYNEHRPHSGIAYRSPVEVFNIPAPPPPHLKDA